MEEPPKLPRQHNNSPQDFFITDFSFLKIFSRTLFHTCETPTIQLGHQVCRTHMEAVGSPSNRYALKCPLHHSSISQMLILAVFLLGGREH